MTLAPVTVTAAPPAATPEMNISVSPEVTRFALPQTTESVSGSQTRETVNIVDPEDSIKYLPSLFVRKRNDGDTQPTIETRSWGVNASARSLVYVDDVPISALIANNNTLGAPRWGVVSPDQIQGMDFLYGPFAAEYPGNSEGGVLLITTRMPDHLETSFSQTESFQDFNIYKTNQTYATSQTSATIGDKTGRVSWFLSANHLDSASQPLFFITNGGIPAGTHGAIAALNKTGGVADVVGAGGLLRSLQDTLTAKVSIDLTDWLKLNYTVSYWDNDTHSSAQSYLTDASGNPTYGGVAGFASDTYNLHEQHLMNAASLKTYTHGAWDGEVVLTRYDYLQDIQNNPSGVGTGLNLKTTGLITRLDGTGWSTQDAKAIWRPDSPIGTQEISFGLHHDRYVLENPTLNTDDWLATPANGNGTLSTDGQGKTEAYALWAQDAWSFPHGLKLTLGGRAEHWRAYDGFNETGTGSAVQPAKTADDFSPKAALSWQVTPDWQTSFSFGQATRFPTVSELYQIVSTGSLFAIPNPGLKPERDTSYEMAVQRQTDNTRIRLSLFEDDTHDAIISQTNQVNSTFTTVFDNVQQTRDRGIELVLQERGWLIPGLELSNSVTYVDSRILSDPSFASATGTTATGKHVPNVPDWRDTVQATYRPNDHLAVTVAGRYSGKQYSTLDNTDSVSGVMGAFDSFFVVDTHVHYQVAKWLTADVGVDNLLDEKYYVFHPFPGRTYFGSVHLTF